jgi:membrane protease subunit HflK
MYIDAMENVLSQTSKVLVDVDGGNNVLYLPLDRIMDRSAGPASPQLTPGAIDQITERVIGNLRERSEPSTRREGRQ